MQKCQTIELRYRIVGLSIRIQITTVYFLTWGKYKKLNFIISKFFLLWFYIFFMVCLSFVVPINTCLKWFTML